VSAYQLSRPDIVRRLFDRYYTSGSERDERFVSSLWAQVSEQFRVVLDDVGHPHVLQAFGFGSPGLDHRLRFGPRLRSAAIVLSQLALTPNRRDVLRLMPAALTVCRRARLRFYFPAFRQVASLALILHHLPARASAPLRIINIGDGYGFLSALIRLVLPDTRLVLVDLGKSLLFQAVTCERTHPAATHGVVLPEAAGDGKEWAEADFIYCPTEYLDEVGRFTFDIAVNIASMGEMNRRAIERYFRFLRRHMRPHANLFYCYNREVKVMRGGERTAFDEYPWSAHDRHLVDGYSPWRNGVALFPIRVPPRIVGVRVPLRNELKRPIRMRLTLLATEADSGVVR